MKYLFLSAPPSSYLLFFFSDIAGASTIFVILCGILYEYREYILPKPKWKEKELGEGREIKKKRKRKSKKKKELEKIKKLEVPVESFFFHRKNNFFFKKFQQQRKLFLNF